MPRTRKSELEIEPLVASTKRTRARRAAQPEKIGPQRDNEIASPLMPSLNNHAFAPSPRRLRDQNHPPLVPSPVPTITSAMSTVAMPTARGKKIHRKGLVVSRTLTPSSGRQSARRSRSCMRPVCRPSAFSMPAAALVPGSGELQLTPIIVGIGVNAIGVDISEGQLRIARRQAESFAARHPNGR